MANTNQLSYFMKKMKTNTAKHNNVTLAKTLDFMNWTVRAVFPGVLLTQAYILADPNVILCSYWAKTTTVCFPLCYFYCAIQQFFPLSCPKLLRHSQSIPALFHYQISYQTPIVIVCTSTLVNKLMTFTRSQNWCSTAASNFNITRFFSKYALLSHFRFVFVTRRYTASKQAGFYWNTLCMRFHFYHKCIWCTNNRFVWLASGPRFAVRRNNRWIIC